MNRAKSFNEHELSKIRQIHHIHVQKNTNIGFCNVELWIFYQQVFCSYILDINCHLKKKNQFEILQLANLALVAYLEKTNRSIVSIVTDSELGNE